MSYYDPRTVFPDAENSYFFGLQGVAGQSFHCGSSERVNYQLTEDAYGDVWGIIIAESVPWHVWSGMSLSIILFSPEESVECAQKTFCNIPLTWGADEQFYTAKIDTDKLSDVADMDVKAAILAFSDWSKSVN